MWHVALWHTVYICLYLCLYKLISQPSAQKESCEGRHFRNGKIDQYQFYAGHLQDMLQAEKLAIM